MTEAEIASLIKQRVAQGGLSWPRAYQNEDVPVPAPVPRLVVNIDRNGRNDVALAGGDAVSIGFLRVLVVVAKGLSTADADAKADQVAALFPKATRVAGADGVIVFTDAASIRAGFRDGSEWVIPVIAPYRAQPN
jgi:Bacteriophage related domain of unknown function